MRSLATHNIEMVTCRLLFLGSIGIVVIAKACEDTALLRLWLSRLIIQTNLLESALLGHTLASALRSALL